MSDKTNKICIIDKHIVQQSQADLTNNGSFEKLNKDPSSKITKSLNEILSMDFCETNIPTYYYKISITKTKGIKKK